MPGVLGPVGIVDGLLVSSLGLVLNTVDSCVAPRFLSGNKDIFWKVFAHKVTLQLDAVKILIIDVFEPM
ncbi:hypothetical protein P5673_024202 [Acropora cervicornis]|uniref:Uncharacterized protein n=1 Tax=Acropora cervicornis TaxID=6130 RepID=A0AAD9UY27_ACRCE|nr:hypothetical protein P5673_024202 [Acropora cervicornis]